MYKFAACNYSIKGWSTCLNGQYCDSCYLGKTQMLNSLDRISWSCVNCSDIFYGCMLCDNAYQCKQCHHHLYAMNGYCYQHDAKTLADRDSEPNY